MHVAFIPYGIKSAIDHFLMDMQAQKHQFRMYKEGKKDLSIWLQGSVRILPFGIYEYVFPKEDLDMVLTTLRFNKPVPYGMGGMKSGMIRKLLNLKKVGNFKTDKKFLWVMDNVSIIPLGIREDGELIEHSGIYKSWSHEAI